MAATELKFVVSLLTEMGNGPPVLPSILKEDNTGAIFMAKNTAIGQRTKHVDIRYRFVNDMILSNDLLVEHIRSGENPSDAMTKNLPLALFGKHASIVSEGLLGNLYDPQNTEDVKSYCATVDAPSTTVSCGQCSDYNCSLTTCSVDLELVVDSDEGWTTIQSKSRSKDKDKTRRLGRPPSMQGSTERSQEACMFERMKTSQG
jgi:hypothetical protein